jgi:hypothetical protein
VREREQQGGASIAHAPLQVRQCCALRWLCQLLTELHHTPTLEEPLSVRSKSPFIEASRGAMAQSYSWMERAMADGGAIESIREEEERGSLPRKSIRKEDERESIRPDLMEKRGTGKVAVFEKTGWFSAFHTILYFHEFYRTRCFEFLNLVLIKYLEIYSRFFRIFFFKIFQTFQNFNVN